MTFWNWRRGTGVVATNGSAAMSPTPELAPIELYTADARIVAWIAPGGQRVTDLLQQSDELRLWRPSPGPIDAVSNGRPAYPDEGVGEWQTIATDKVILAMPPEWRASRQLRLHRRLRRVAVLAGPFSVTGNIHMAPGTEPGLHLITRGQRFLPLTDAYLLHNAEPHFEHVVSVVIINSVHVAQIVSLVTLA